MSMNTLRGFNLLAITLILAVLLGGGYVAYRNYPQPTTYNQPQQSEATVVPVDWKTYSNEEYGFEFRYPPNFSIVTDKVHIKYIGHPKGFNWYRVELTDALASESPFLRFEVDPDGYGPFHPDKGYVVSENADGVVSAVPTSVAQSEYQNDGLTFIGPSSLTARNGHTYYWQFSFKEGGKDWEPVYKDILSTFRFIR